MELNDEIWKPLKGLEEYYLVSNCGRVKRKERICERGNKSYKLHSKILLPTINSVGYYVINFKIKGISTYSLVHRLIADTFIENTDPKVYDLVNHIDGNKLNNSVHNLEWVNRRENYTHWARDQNHKSKYTGVTYNQKSKKWGAAIRLGALKRIGEYKTEEEAAAAYLNALKENNLTNRYATL